MSHELRLYLYKLSLEIPFSISHIIAVIFVFDIEDSVILLFIVLYGQKHCIYFGWRSAIDMLMYVYGIMAYLFATFLPSCNITVYVCIFSNTLTLFYQ